MRSYYNVSGRLKQELARVGYDALRCQRYPAQRSICSLPRFSDIDVTPAAFEDVRIDKLMTAGDTVREVSNRGDALVLLSIVEIQRLRIEKAGNPEKPLPRTAFIFHSLKHPEEVRTLRKIYGSSFIVISIYTPLASRLEQLKERIAKSRRAYNPDPFSEQARELIGRDHQEVGTRYGQNVSSTFPEGDFFIDATKQDNLPAQMTRLVNVLFGDPFITPSVDEYGMFHPKAAALRSADLSRPVGAVITSDRGEIISASCNEVPQAQGGAFWEGQDSSKDYRDFRIGHDSAARMKHELVIEINSARMTSMPGCCPI
jgi:deoxycytidylate deaminase